MIFGSKSKRRKFSVHVAEWKNCTRCPIGTSCTQKVIARGTFPCDILVIAEGPGEAEDAVGFPLVGPSGRILNEWVAVIANFELRFAYTNLVACRPTTGKNKNRTPTDQEKNNCWERLVGTIQLAAPKGVMLLGKQAETFRPLNTFLCQAALPHVGLYHPAYVLRNGGKDGEVGRHQFREFRTFAKIIRDRVDA